MNAVLNLRVNWRIYIELNYKEVNGRNIHLIQV